jgi:uracil-DNA glycosylase
VSYHDPHLPDELLTAGALVVTDTGEVHELSSAPSALDELMAQFGVAPRAPIEAAYEREGEGLALLADVDPDEADGLAAWAASRRPWPDALGEEMTKPYFRDLERFVQDERSRFEIYPEHRDLYAAFGLTPYEQVRVVLLGQDPYPNPGEAHGLCFSVPRGVRLPASLRNIHAAMRLDGLTPPGHGDLTGWAKQGALLLNTALTVRRGEPGSHAREWRPFTDAVIRKVDDLDHPVVFVLWGQAALEKRRLITNRFHAVIEAPHPASRAEAQVRFRESRIFSRVNQALRRVGDKPLDWEALDG